MQRRNPTKIEQWRFTNDNITDAKWTRGMESERENETQRHTPPNRNKSTWWMRVECTSGSLLIKTTDNNAIAHQFWTLMKSRQFMCKNILNSLLIKHATSRLNATKSERMVCFEFCTQPFSQIQFQVSFIEYTKYDKYNINV